MRLINTEIAGEPLNWIKIPLMAAFFLIGLELVTALFFKNVTHISPASNTGGVPTAL